MQQGGSGSGSLTISAQSSGQIPQSRSTPTLSWRSLLSWSTARHVFYTGGKALSIYKAGYDNIANGNCGY